MEVDPAEREEEDAPRATLAGLSPSSSSQAGLWQLQDKYPLSSGAAQDLAASSKMATTPKEMILLIQSPDVAVAGTPV